jgi:hypothetical protein
VSLTGPTGKNYGILDFFPKLWHFRLYGQKPWQIRRLPYHVPIDSVDSAVLQYANHGGLHAIVQR